MNRKIPILLLGLAILFSHGCIQEKLVIPVATVTGKLVPPPGLVPTGSKVTVAGNPDIYAWVNEKGEFKLEFTKSGRYLLVFRGLYYDVDFIWADAYVEQTTALGDIKLTEKIVGEGKWIATIVDYPKATAFKIKSINPKWATQTVDLYDDGTHNDKFAGDGIYTTRLQNLYDGSQLYSLIWIDGDGEHEEKDPHRESDRIGYSQLTIPSSGLKIARGKVTSALIGVDYSEVVLGTKMGSRKINCDSDGAYSISMEGNAKEYLVFRSPTFHIRAVPVDLTTISIYDVPTITLTAKAGGEAKFILVKSDFQEVVNPTVVADFTSWQPQQLYDDGTHGDDTKGDGVYSLMITGVAPGYHKYAFNLKDGNQVRDPYEESGDSQYSILLVK